MPLLLTAQGGRRVPGKQTGLPVHMRWQGNASRVPCMQRSSQIRAASSLPPELPKRHAMQAPTCFCPANAACDGCSALLCLSRGGAAARRRRRGWPPGPQTAPPARLSLHDAVFVKR